MVLTEEQLRQIRLKRDEKGRIIYYARGQIRMEGVWRTVYSAETEDGRPVKEWLTRRRCFMDARELGAKAVLREFKEKGE
jgi:hypothetical protein